MPTTPARTVALFAIVTAFGWLLACGSQVSAQSASRSADSSEASQADGEPVTGALASSASSASSASVVQQSETSRKAGLARWDWAIIILYAIGTIALGAYFGGKNESAKDYFVGSGKMNPILIGVSLFATLLSTISYMSMPGESLGKGPMNLSSLLGLPIVFLVVSYVMLPVYMSQRVTSAYELLDRRLGRGARLAGAIMFIILRLVWMALLMFATAKALVIMMQLDDRYIPLIALAAGSVAVIYTSIGGMRAVVVTDFLQTVLLYCGALLVIGFVSYQLGGFSWVPTAWNPAWDTQPIFSVNPATRVTFVGAIANYVVWYIATSGGDQTSVQRFMAVEDVRAARFALGTQMVVTTLVVVTLGLVGFALLAYYQQNPASLPAEWDLKENADKIFPHFIAFELPTGIAGLVVAAMFAAAMSSIDSGVNSITAVILVDFMAVEDKKKPDDHSQFQQVWLPRVLALVIGAIVVVTSSLMGHVDGNITAVTSKTSNLLTTPIFGLFFLALFVPFANSTGAVAGAVTGAATAFLIAFSGPIFGKVPDPSSITGELTDPISFQWIAPVAFAVNVLVGCVVSLATAPPAAPSQGS